VGAIWVILAARSRRYWQAWLVLTLLVTLGTGLVLAAVTAGRRADSAFPRFVAAHGFDGVVYASSPLPLTRLPDVAQAVEIHAPFLGQPGCSCGLVIDDSSFAVREVPPSALPRVVKLVAGRMPDQSDPDEVLASFTMQRDYGIGPGTLIRLPMAGASQWPAIQAALNGGSLPKPNGPVITARVTGIVVAENEFPSGQGAAYDLYPTQAFATATKGTPALPFYYVRLRHGAADFARFEAKVSGPPYNAGVDELDRDAAAVTASIHPQAVAWWVLAALAGVTALVVTGQALARQSAAEDDDGPVLAALGLRSWQSAALSMLRTLGVAVAGAAGGVGVAILLSVFVPVGEARLADPAPGLAVDWPVAVAGAAAAVAAVLLLGLPPALRTVRRRLAARPDPVVRRSRAAGAAAALGLPVAVVLGIRHALQRGSGARAAPVRTGLAGAVMAVTALCAIAVFGASLSHLIGSPDLYGDPFQAYFNSSGPGAVPADSLVRELDRDPAVDRVTLITASEITVGRLSVRSFAAAPVRGRLLLSPADGRLPAGDHEIALGVATMHAAGTRIGDTVQVTVTSPDGAARRTALTVVGTLAIPADFGTGGLGTGAALTTDAYVAAQCPSVLAPAALRQCRQKAGARPPDAVLVHTTPGPAGTAALARYSAQERGNVVVPTVPTALVSFGESANFPLLVAIVVAVSGIATLIHLLAVSVTRRRQESGLLKTLGFVRAQLAAVVFWQAATVAVVGVAIGVPLGLAAGRAIWDAFAANLGVVPVTVLPAWLIAALAGGFLVTALVIAAFPARAAANARTSQLLRTE
jgi:hypothetical protein